MFFFLLSACSYIQSGPVADLNKPLRIVTTISPLYSLTANLVKGVDVSLINLVSPRASVHTFQLKPGDVKALEKADLIIINGLNLEHFLGDALKNSPAKIVDSSEKIVPIPFTADAGGDEDVTFDPHIWLDPLNAGRQAVAIAAALQTADPDHSEIYERNKQDLLKKLAILDNASRERIANLNIDGNFILFHDAYAYFNRRYEIKPTAVLREFPEEDPSLRHLNSLIKIMESRKIGVIFTEPQFKSSVVDSLAREYSLQVAELDPIGADLSEEGYFNLFEKNLAAFEKIFPKQ